MLRKLSVKNFAIIAEQSIELGGGFNALTGETGAGKSILVEALGFLLGARGSSSWLRAGAERLEVSGVFDRDDLPKEWRSLYKLSDTTALLKRELDASGRTRATVNGIAAPVSALASLGERIVDFHGQHQHQSLLKPAFQLEVLDRFGELLEERGKVALSYQAWAALKSESEQAHMSDDERRRLIDLYRFQLGEIQQAALKPGEEEELESALPRLKNGERLKTFADGAYQLLYEQESSILSQLLKAERALSELCRVDAALASTHETVESARLSLEEAAHCVAQYRERLNVEPEELDKALSRMEEISRLKKKYGPSLDEVLGSQKKLSEELDRLENFESRREKIEGELAQVFARLEEDCDRLHKARLKAAVQLERGLLKELKLLGLPESRFSVSVELEEGRYGPQGADAVEFMIASNPGEPLRPVREIASGGELSRVMLALKTVLSSADSVSILVFDEVDAGIGGAVARAVGQKLARLGRGRQVLCVTHLAQVACFAQSHFHVSKAVSGGRTKVAVERLEGERRLQAIARMLGGRDSSAAGLKHAQELLEESVA
ncbi:MAG: DNA repair protein RecN [Elusimicrobia bacterium]|nr:DNA repair protein RecN [Elusimicrobiota bacterium]